MAQLQRGGFGGNARGRQRASPHELARKENLRASLRPRSIHRAQKYLHREEKNCWELLQTAPPFSFAHEREMMCPSPLGGENNTLLGPAHGSCVPADVRQSKPAESARCFHCITSYLPVMERGERGGKEITGKMSAAGGEEVSRGCSLPLEEVLHPGNPPLPEGHLRGQL